MRGTRAKAIRRHVRTRYPFLSTDSLYMKRGDGVIVLAQQCQRALTQAIKRRYKRKVSYGMV